MASLLLAEDQLEELTAVLDGIAGGAAPGNITAGKLRSLASSAHRAASRLQAFEDKQYSRAEAQAAKGDKLRVTSDQLPATSYQLPVTSGRRVAEAQAAA